MNRVAALHSQLLVRDVLGDFHELEPEKFVNVTNGVTLRRRVALANPALAETRAALSTDKPALPATPLLRAPPAQGLMDRPRDRRRS